MRVSLFEEAFAGPMDEKQATLQEQVVEQNKQLVDFCNIVSHNLRAPLVNISMLAQFINETSDPEEQKLLVSKLNPVVENLQTIFNGLVESIQIKRDLVITSEYLFLDDCASMVFEDLAAEINSSVAEIEIDFDDAPVVYFPSKYLFSIFHNLISNSLRYHSPKRKPIIKLQSKKVDESVLISISDNGLGIDLSKHKDDFFKLGKVFHRHPDARGLGLYMIKTQIEAMGGKIWVQSVQGMGSTFFVEFKEPK
jgi:light-regulated signal transduction histidine kinase (bacteriophytochrome)